jgi:hypothetical protein
MKMIKTFAIAFVCVASVVSMAQAQTPGSAGATVGAGRTGITGGSSVVTPPASSGVGVSGGASAPTSQPAQPSMDINRAQQPGIGVNTGGSGNGSTR